jgi:hypothetical protein
VHDKKVQKLIWTSAELAGNERGRSDAELMRQAGVLTATHAEALDTQARAHAGELEATEATWALSRKEYELATAPTGPCW